MSATDPVTIDAPPDEDENVLDPGPNPFLGERAYRTLRERFADDFEGAHEDACRMSDELARLYRDEALLRRPFERRIERLDEVIARAQERVEKLRGMRVTLEANREAALAPNRKSREWRLNRLDEFRRDYNERLRLTKKAASLRLTGGTFRFTHHNPTRKLVEQMGADGTPLAGKTDEAAIMEVLAVLRRCGLHDAYEPLVDVKPKVAIAEVKKLLKWTENGPVAEVFVKGNPEGLADRVAAEGGEAWMQVNRATGEVTGWTVTFRAVQVIRDADGQVVMERPLLREVPPPEEWTLGFVPSEPGQVPEDEGGETDGVLGE